MSLSSSAQKVQGALNNLGYNYNIIEFSESTRTAEEAATRVGCEVGKLLNR